MTDNKLDMFELLGNVDKRNITFYESLTAEQKKSFAPVVAMRWFSSGNPTLLQLSNTILNPMVFRMYQHPNLMYKMMVACSDGKSKRYAWIKKKPKDKSKNATIALVAAWNQCSEVEARRNLFRYTEEDILEMADDLGYDKDQVKKVKAELK